MARATRVPMRRTSSLLAASFLRAKMLGDQIRMKDPITAEWKRNGIW